MLQRTPRQGKNTDYQDSVLLLRPPTSAVTDAETNNWQTLKEHTLRGACSGSFIQMLIIFVHSFYAGSIAWNNKMLHDIFGPVHNSQNRRYKLLVYLNKVVQSHGACDQLSFQVDRELLQEFLRPILSEKNPYLTTLQYPFQSTPIRELTGILDRLGLNVDMELLIDLRGRLRHILPPRLVNDCQVLTSFSMLQTYDIHREIIGVGRILGTSLDTMCITIIAYGRSTGGATFLRSWSETLAAQHFVSDIEQRLEQSSSLPQRLALLVVAYLIHYHFFGNGDNTDSVPHIPSHLSRNGSKIFFEAMISFADKFGQNNVLKFLAPSKASESPLSPDRHKVWKDYWNQTHPKFWSENLPGAEAAEMQALPKCTEALEMQTIPDCTGASQKPRGWWSFRRLFQCSGNRMKFGKEESFFL